MISIPTFNIPPPPPTVPPPTLPPGTLQLGVIDVSPASIIANIPNQPGIPTLYLSTHSYFISLII